MNISEVINYVTPSEHGCGKQLQVSSISKDCEWILNTNFKNDVTLLGVAKGKLRDSKKEPWREAYFVLYQLAQGEMKRAEINKELYNSLFLVFDTILAVESPDLTY